MEDNINGRQHKLKMKHDINRATQCNLISLIKTIPKLKTAKQNLSELGTAQPQLVKGNYQNHQFQK